MKLGGRIRNWSKEDPPQILIFSLSSVAFLEQKNERLNIHQRNMNYPILQPTTKWLHFWETVVHFYMQSLGCNILMCVGVYIATVYACEAEYKTNLTHNNHSCIKILNYMRQRLLVVLFSVWLLFCQSNMHPSKPGITITLRKLHITSSLEINIPN